MIKTPHSLRGFLTGAFRPLLSVPYLLPPAFSLLLSFSCLLPTAFCLLTFEPS
jgi:hypothetical protein